MRLGRLALAATVQLVVAGCLSPSDPSRVREDPKGGWTYFFDVDPNFLTQDRCCILPEEAARNVAEHDLRERGLVPKECINGITVVAVSYAEGGKGSARFLCK
jgi:hypothetical protein